jgi:hypothetical protein
MHIHNIQREQESKSLGPAKGRVEKPTPECTSLLVRFFVKV